MNLDPISFAIGIVFGVVMLCVTVAVNERLKRKLTRSSESKGE